ncbi:Uncharacterised protein [Actinomyces viscosus]|uniref:Uncharacterized protein n=1 Tax=Actinomyces viscosus TaxID=1656 RepID=A0A448PJF6_ACTVI|nr:Uncharacterised protein [Actinomyces viscosus]
MPRTRRTPQSSRLASPVTMRFTRFDDGVVIPSPSGRPEAQDVGHAMMATIPTRSPVTSGFHCFSSSR